MKNNKKERRKTEIKEVEEIIWSNGVTARKYHLIDRNEVIPEGAIHRLGDTSSFYSPIANPKTIGKTPSQFSDDRYFYRPGEKVTEEEYEEYLDYIYRKRWGLLITDYE